MDPQNYRRHIWKALAVAVLSYAAWIVLTSSEASFSSAQGRSLPFYCFGVLALVTAFQFPAAVKLCVAFGVMATLLSTRVKMLDFMEPSPELLISRFSDDKLDISSTLFRRSLEAQLVRRQVTVPLRQAQHVYQSDEEIRSAFAEGNPPLLVVWGSARFARVSVFYNSFTNEGVTELEVDGRKFSLVGSVPNFGLSVEPIESTEQFFADLLEGLQALTLGRTAEAEVALRAAAGVEGFWTSYAHRAYPLFLLLNLHVSQALGGGQFESHSLRCAIRALEEAYGFLRYRDNPELRAAVRNNLTVLKWVEGVASGERVSKKQLTKSFKSALGYGRTNNLFGADKNVVQVLQHNLQALKVKRSVKKKRKSGDKRNRARKRRS